MELSERPFLRSHPACPPARHCPRPPVPSLRLTEDVCGRPINLPERSIVRALRHVHAFSVLRLSELVFVASAGLPILYQPGDTIFEQGDNGCVPRACGQRPTLSH